MAQPPKRRRLRLRVQEVEGHHAGDRALPFSQQRQNHFSFLPQAGIGWNLIISLPLLLVGYWII